ncbi:D-Ala-D-Ala dipeptidase [Rhodomicrobium vannielii ATCC 17100]|uniref:D-alanyl-D-alanine dipeptidase n=1 Tax=Rhodomicrobium vannielii (strain ATCC 17100 / DSM 162 / LMG 4299 / NCIMB 10020 / ATH 3.1.1) TaxID=648757 RepID=E3I5I9_RHOVT|nr:M15 family metallopeptidase [Rhodomicrobium vannielii]ADP72800.1 D-Ala-D-Ala dipeptidase [Rhodomicrobium vannielii ATCC 17100]
MNRQSFAATLFYVAAALAPASAQAELPDGFVYLRDVAPDIQQDMRYAGLNNFTGSPVLGYEAAECVLRRDAAEALQRAQRSAQALGLSLKVFDCYRPERAVRAFGAWARAPENERTKSQYPRLPKGGLVPNYIASRSSHSTGLAVDLTLVRQGRSDRSPLVRDNCIAPARGPADEPKGVSSNANALALGELAPGELDMGTSFDCFDRASNTAFPGLTPEQRRSRDLLVTLMERAGFTNYPAEWWHFSLARAKNRRSYDVPITPRPAR